MTAIVVTLEDNVPQLLWEEVPEIKPGPEEVLVDIKATAELNLGAVLGKSLRIIGTPGKLFFKLPLLMLETVYLRFFSGSYLLARIHST